MWLAALLGLLVALVGLYLFRGWIAWLVRQRRREQRYPIVAPRQRPRPADWPTDRLTISWLGHATVLINFYGSWILTDPVLGDRVGLHLPGGLTLGPRRLVRCALTPEELPPLDLILQSHAHLDHLDTWSWQRLRRGPAVVLAARNARYLRRLGFAPLTELRWGETLDVAGVRVTALPARHWGERFPWSRGHGYNAYLLERSGRTILFGGDTAETDAFQRAVAGRRVDVAILPIGGYSPYIHSHASPEQAWRMAREMPAAFLVPIHHRTFILSHEPPAEPLERLVAAAGDQADRIVLREVGETFVLPEA